MAEPLALVPDPAPVARSRHSTLSDVEALGERIAELSAQIQAATYQLLVMLRDFDERAGWNVGFRSCAHWLNWRTGLDLGAAREKVRVAGALAALPRLSEAMRHGQISYAKVRALTRVATAANEAELLVFAKAGTAAHVEKLVRLWRRTDRLAERELEQLRHAGRYVRAHTDEDGMVVLQARLDPEAGAALLKALAAAGDKLYEAGERSKEPGEPVTAEQRRADALGLVAESALAGGLDPGTRGDRYQVVLHVDAEALREDGDAGSAALEDGRSVSAETSRRLACDAALVVMRHGPDGKVLDVGRRTRTVSPALRRALAHRDGGCRFPGCGLKLCDAHHVEHWADGGKTKLGNLVQLCRFHHRAVHEEGYTVRLLDNGEVLFYRPGGRLLEQVPPLSAVDGEGVARLAGRVEGERERRDGWASVPSWDGGMCDYGLAIGFMRSLGLGEGRARPPVQLAPLGRTSRAALNEER